jgi:LysM repeat protein
MRRVFIVSLILLTTVLVFTPLTAGASDAAQTCGPDVIHVVAQGENLFRISLRYGTTMSAIANANGIANIHRIFAGDSLVIPCPGTMAAGVSGTSPFMQPVVAAPPAVVQPLAQVFMGAENGLSFVAPLTADCSHFRLSSPLDGLANGSNLFYWDPAPGATSYRINVYNPSLPGGPLVVSHEVSGAITHLQAGMDDGSIGSGLYFVVETQALVGDQIACSQRVVLLRSVPPTPAPTAAPAPAA